MGSIELIEEIIRVREAGRSSAHDGRERDNVATIADYQILNNRQIAGALNISHTLVNRYNKPIEGQRGHINWDSVEHILHWLKGDDASTSHLEALGSRRKPLEWLWKNK